jgi:predicted ATP-binding protein involved in virulence
MKIRKLIIKNYKIFDDVEFDFTDAEGNTLDTAVLAGVNGCGKATVLEVVRKFLEHRFSQDFDKSKRIFSKAPRRGLWERTLGEG